MYSPAVIGHFGEQIPTFLRIEPADLAEQGDFGSFGERRPPLELGLQREQLLALALERMLIREVEVDLYEEDVAQLSSVRSTWDFS